MLSTIRIRWRRSITALISLACPLLLLAGVVATASPASASSWTTSQLTPPASAFRNIASLATSPTSMEVFWVAQNGSVQEEYWLGTTWSSYTIAPPGSADPYSDIAAVARVKNAINWTIDLFWVAPDGSIKHRFNGNGLPWLTEPDVAPPGSAAAPGASMTVVSRAPNTWELFWLGPNTEIKDAYWYQGGPSGSFTLAAAGPSTPTLNPRQITAVSRASNTMEVWWIGKNGSVRDAYYYDTAGWNSFQLAAPGSAYVGNPPGQITAVSRASNTMEVWWIGPAHSVQDAYIFLPGTWNFFTLEPAGSAEFALAATSQAASSMDVFFRANGGNEVENASFVPPWSPPKPLEPPGPLDTGGITAISRTPASEDAFWVTWNGAIEHASK